MKLSTGAAKNGRIDQRERQRRERAAAPQMRVVYPKIKSLRLDFVFKDDISPLPAPQSLVMHPPANAYFVFPCPYFDCDGQFDLASEVEALSKRENKQGSGHVRCCGNRSRDRTGRAPCGLQLEYSLEAARE